MKESRRKGIANYPDPESCSAGREACAEALTGAHAGWLSRPEKGELERRRRQAKRKAIRAESTTRDSERLHGVGDPTHANDSTSEQCRAQPAAMRKRRKGQYRVPLRPRMAASGYPFHSAYPNRLCQKEKHDD